MTPVTLTSVLDPEAFIEVIGDQWESDDVTLFIMQLFRRKPSYKTAQDCLEYFQEVVKIYQESGLDKSEKKMYTKGRKRK
jgi:hypothetical protein